MKIVIINDIKNKECAHQLKKYLDVMVVDCLQTAKQLLSDQEEGEVLINLSVLISDGDIGKKYFAPAAHNRLLKILEIYH